MKHHLGWDTMSNNSGVYIIENIINGKWYIGSSLKLNTRYQLHMNSLKRKVHHNWKLQRDFNKYGEDTFIYKILLFLDGEIIRTIEREMIEYFETYKDSGYNINRDTLSRFGSKQSEITKKKISDSLKKFKKEHGHNKTGSRHSKETRGKMSKAQIERFKNPEELEKLKREVSLETRKKLSEKARGRKMSEEQKKLISRILTGKKRGPLSEEHKKKISDTFKRKRSL